MGVKIHCGCLAVDATGSHGKDSHDAIDNFLINNHHDDTHPECSAMSSDANADGEDVSIPINAHTVVAYPQIFPIAVNTILSASNPGDPAFASHRAFLASLYWARFQNSDQLEDVEGVIKYYLESINATPEASAELPSRQQPLGSAYIGRYNITYDAQDLELAIKYLHLSVAGTDITDRDISTRHQVLGIAYSTKFRRFQQLEDVDSALRYHMAGLAAIPAGHPNITACKHNIGGTYIDKYRASGDIADLELALRYHKEAVDSLPENDARLPAYLQGLAVCYGERFQKLDNIVDVESELACLKTAVSMTPRSSPDYAYIHESIGVAYLTRFRRLENVDDLESALEAAQASIAATPMNHPRFSTCVGNLGSVYQVYFQERDNLEYLDNAIKCSAAAVTATQLGISDRAFYLRQLATCYSDKYERLSNITDFESSFANWRAATDATPVGHPDHILNYQGLSRSYHTRFSRFGDLDDLKQALEYGHAALNLMSSDDPHYAWLCATVASAYNAKFQRHGTIADIESAMDYQNKAVLSTPKGHTRLSFIQRSLAQYYGHHFQVSNDLNDLVHALKHGLEALSSTSIKHAADTQQTLAIIYSFCFDKLGTLSNLELAIKYGELAVSGTPKGNTKRAQMLQSLGGYYMSRFQLLNQPQDDRQAMQYLQAGLEETPSDHADRALRHLVLGIAYIERFRKTVDPEDAETGIKHHKLAVTHTANENPHKNSRKMNIGMGYMLRFQAFKDIADLEQALKYLHETASFVSNDSYKSATYMGNLAVAYQLAFKSSNDIDDLYCALYYADQSINGEESLPADVWELSRFQAKLAASFVQPECLNGFKKAIHALPDILWSGSTITEHHNALIHYDVSEMAMFATKSCLFFNQIPLAVELLEQCLAVTYQELLKLKGEQTELFEQHPAIAKQFKELSLRLQQPVKPDDPIGDSLIFEVAVQRTDLIGKIRQKIGFERFLLPAEYSHLSMAAENGPVIMLCDTHAIIIMSPNTPPLMVNFLFKTQEEAWIQHNKLKEGLNALRIPSRDVIVEQTRFGHQSMRSTVNERALFNGVVTWLYIRIVQPVFNALKANGYTSGRIWWCPTGVFTYLPIHAAHPRNTFIPSYTSTLGALIHARNKSKTVSPNTPAKVTAIGIPKIPGQPKLTLPLIGQEIEKIKLAVGDTNLQSIMGEEATSTHILSILPSCSWLHLACHGQQNLMEPLKSRLLLYQGQLELGQILNTNLVNAEFVFLSACQTAMGDSRLINESMHLAGGLVYAGFQGAIGTLWNMVDSDGPKVAEKFYGELFKDNRRPEAHEAAEALHNAIQALRNEGAGFHQWASFIHTGI